MALKQELESKEAGCDSVQDFIKLCHEAINEPFDRNYAKSCLATWQQRLRESKTDSAYDYAKLSERVYNDLSDANWARELLVEAELIGGDYFFWAYMAKITSRMNDKKQSLAYLQKAVDLCNTPERAVQLVNRLFRDGMDKKQVRKIYLQMRLNMQSARDELAWAEKIIVLFKDVEWALKTYDELATRMTSIDEKKLFNFSRYVRFSFQIKAI